MKRFKLFGLFCALFCAASMQAQITQLVVETTDLTSVGTITDAFGGGVQDFTGFTAYKVYAEVSDPNDALLSMFGSFDTFDNEAHPLVFSTTTGFFNHNEAGGIGIEQADPAGPTATVLYPSIIYDTYLTIGVKYSGDPDFASPFLQAQGGTPAETTEFEATFSPADYGVHTAGSNGSTFSSQDFALFSTPQSSNAYAEADGRVYLGQFVTDGIFSFQINSTFNESTNGTDGVGGDGVFYYAANSVMSATNTEIVLPGGIYTSEVATPGCTDGMACNFDMDATEDDGSCVYADEANCIFCVDGELETQDADGDGVCDADEVAGCTDNMACNFSASATDDDGTCVFADEAACEICDNGGITVLDADGDGVCDFDEVDGCTSETACNYDELATDDDGSCEEPDNANCVFCVNGAAVLQDADGDGICDGDETGGCTAEAACNYDETATDDDGSCVFADENCEVCMDGAVVLQDADGDGVCDGDEVDGCTDAMACNYNDAATDEDGTCVYADEANCIFCVNGALETQDADGDGVCDGDEITGCTDVFACNFDTNATDDDSSCVFADEAACEICDDGGVTVLDADGDGVCDFDEVAGCTSPTACNYDELATDEDGSCVEPDEANCIFCEGEEAVLQDEDGDGVCDADEAGGCTDDTACNYDPFATEDNGLCVYADDLCEVCDGAGGVELQDADGDGVCDGDEVDGCTDAMACNYNDLATDDDGSCVYADETNCIFCVDGELATVDADGDGVCDFDEVAGCTDDAACNYDVEATDDDGSCVVLAAAAISTMDATTICAGDGIEDPINVDIVGGSGPDFTFVITDEDGNILAVPGDNGPFSLEGAGTGVCSIYNVAYADGAPAAGDNVNTLDGACNAVSNGIAVTRNGGGCTDVTALNYNEDACFDDGSCAFEAVLGCTDENACNYDAEATEDDGSCVTADAELCEVCNDAGGVDTLDADGDGVCDGDEVPGCTDVTATNYNPMATDDDGSCSFDGTPECGVSSLIASHCDGTFALTGSIKANWIGCPSNYIFNFTDGDGNTTSYGTGAAYTILFLNSTDLTPGTYSVSVSTVQSSGTFTGPACDITIEGPSTCVLSPYTAPNEVSLSGFMKVAYIGQAADYTWKFTRSDIAELPFYYSPGSNFTRAYVNQLPMVPGASYTVEVRIESSVVGGGVSATDPGAGMYGPAKTVIVEGGIDVLTFNTTENETFTTTEGSVLSVYPNPSTDGNFTMNLSGLATEEGMVNVTIFDATGKTVSAQAFAVNEGRVLETMNLNAVQSGLYIVQIVIGDDVQTERLMIQK